MTASAGTSASASSGMRTCALLLHAFAAGALALSREGPCDITGAAGHPCVAAHSTTRALYGAYDGPSSQSLRAFD